MDGDSIMLSGGERERGGKSDGKRISRE